LTAIKEPKGQFQDDGPGHPVASCGRIIFMTWLFLAVAAFLATHTIPALPRLRSRLIAWLGWRSYMVAYSALSLLVIGWVAWAYRQAPYQPLWDYDPRLNWVPLLVMPWALVAISLGVVRPTPLSLSFFNDHRQFDPARPGLLRFSRHPLLWGFLLWAVAHMVPNGDAASLLLFGLLAVLSAAGMVGLDLKRRRSLGRDRWQALAIHCPIGPWPASGARWKITTRDGLAVVLGIALYGLILAFHQKVIGVSPFPPL
jgi:uncharacterized membrane protein